MADILWTIHIQYIIFYEGRKRTRRELARLLHSVVVRLTRWLVHGRNAIKLLILLYALVALAFQVGGHAGVETTADGSLIIKPVRRHKLRFCQPLQQDCTLAVYSHSPPSFLVHSSCRVDLIEGYIVDLKGMYMALSFFFTSFELMGWVFLERRVGEPLVWVLEAQHPGR